MKYEIIAAQGEITILRIVGGSGKLPKNGRPLAQENGRYVIGHSETGHHHVLSRTDGVAICEVATPPAGMRILYAILEQPMALNHLREHDTHAPITLEPGEYELRIAREYDPYEELALSAD
jgi:hypothetical protein